MITRLRRLWCRRFGHILRRSTWPSRQDNRLTAAFACTRCDYVERVA